LRPRRYRRCLPHRDRGISQMAHDPRKRDLIYRRGVMGGNAWHQSNIYFEQAGLRFEINGHEAWLRATFLASAALPDLQAFV
jgi:hypothetical protein